MIEKLKTIKKESAFDALSLEKMSKLMGGSTYSSSYTRTFSKDCDSTKVCCQGITTTTTTGEVTTTEP